MKHLRFAKQRFSSAADLVAKVVVVLLPIATLLAMPSADQRCTHEDRERAEVSLLCKLQSKFCLALWLSVVRCVLKGRISNLSSRRLSSTATYFTIIGGYLGKHGVRPQFVTRRVEKQLRHRCVFQGGGKISLLWKPCKPDEVKEVAGRLRNVAEHVIASVDSEFPETDLRFATQCFDIAKFVLEWQTGGRLNAKLAMR